MNTDNRITVTVLTGFLAEEEMGRWPQVKHLVIPGSDVWCGYGNYCCSRLRSCVQNGQ